MRWSENGTDGGWEEMLIRGIPMVSTQDGRTAGGLPPETVRP